MCGTAQMSTKSEESQEERIDVNTMRMLRWMCRVTDKNKSRNEHVRRSYKVAPVTKKIPEKRPKWCERIKRLKG